jgi:hypothetical protein
LTNVKLDDENNRSKFQEKAWRRALCNYTEIYNLQKQKEENNREEKEKEENKEKNRKENGEENSEKNEEEENKEEKEKKDDEKYNNESDDGETDEKDEILSSYQKSQIARCHLIDTLELDLSNCQELVQELMKCIEQELQNPRFTQIVPHLQP